VAIVISESIVAGDTSVSVAPNVGSMLFAGQEPTQSTGVSLNASAGALHLNGGQAASDIGIAVQPAPGVLSIDGTTSALTIGVSPAPDSGLISILGSDTFAVAKGRICVVSSSMVLVPPRPVVCVDGTAAREANLNATYQFEEC